MRISDWSSDVCSSDLLTFDLSSVVRNMAGPSNPHARVAVSDLAAKGISGQWDDVPGQMPDGAVIIAAITSCTNTSNPRNAIAARSAAGRVGQEWVNTDRSRWAQNY